MDHRSVRHARLRMGDIFRQFCLSAKVALLDPRYIGLARLGSAVLLISVI